MSQLSSIIILLSAILAQLENGRHVHVDAFQLPFLEKQSPRLRKSPSSFPGPGSAVAASPIPIDPLGWPDKFPAKEHCSKCGLCETSFVANVTDACAFLNDGMSKIDVAGPNSTGCTDGHENRIWCGRHPPTGGPTMHSTQLRKLASEYCSNR